MIDIGRARVGMMVADTFRRNRKITMMTRAMVSMRVNLTSRTDSRIETERSYRTFRSTDAGICARNVGSSARIEFTTSTVLVPGWRWMASTMARVSLYQLATLSFSTLSMAA